MPLRAGSALVLLGLLGIAPALRAQIGWELGGGVIGLASDPGFLGGGPLVALRSGGRLRVQLTLAPGVVDDRTAGRGELVAHFLLQPGRLGGAGVYGLGGIAGEVGPRQVGWVMLGIGVEGAPGGASGWWLEGGIGGGARVAVGWRWRRLHFRGRS